MVEANYAVRGAPWSALGINVEGTTTAKQMIEKAELDWEVELRPVATAGSPGHKPILLKDQAIVRMDTDEVFGLVRDYTPIQNVECFDFTEELVGKGELEYVNAGSYRGSGKVFLLARLPKDIVIGSGKTAQTQVPYLYLYTGHDGKTALCILPTMLNVWCDNMHNMVKRESINGNRSKRLMFRMEHRGNMVDRVAKAREAIALSSVEFELFGIVANMLDGIDITDKLTSAVLDRLFPEPKESASGTPTAPWVQTKWEDTRALLHKNLKVERPTAWGLFNAITGYWDHQYVLPGTLDNPKRPNMLMDFRTEGRGASEKEKAMDIVLSMTKSLDKVMAERQKLMVPVR